jgi:4'-phosphopantetheinyl transferase
MKVFEYIDSRGKFELRAYSLSAGEFVLPSTELFLSDSELVILEKIKNSKRKKQFLYSRFFLKQRLSEILALNPSEIKFSLQGEGKPVLDLGSAVGKKSIDFNISHTGDLILIGISEYGKIGVDIELFRQSKHLQKIAERLFSAAENDYLNSLQDKSDTAVAFTKIWSAKEALVKTFAGGVLKHASEISINAKTWGIESLPANFGEPGDLELHFFSDVADHVISCGYLGG